MIKVALKGLAGRKVRALLTALAVVIGVSMVSGTFVLTDTMQKAFDGIFDESYEGTDAVVNGKQLVEFSTGGRATVPDSLLRDSVDTLGQTTVMVTHDAHAAEIADRVLFLADGEIVRDLPRCSAHTILETLEDVTRR